MATYVCVCIRERERERERERDGEKTYMMVTPGEMMQQLIFWIGLLVKEDFKWCWLLMNSLGHVERVPTLTSPDLRIVLSL